MQHLRAPHGGGGEILVQAIHEMDVVGQQRLLVLEEIRVEHADRRTTIARDEHPGLQAPALIHADLIQGQPHDGFDASQVYDSILFGERASGVLLR